MEYRLPFVCQVQVNPRAERVPGRILRHFLRHDPDVILVGEIRDRETAEVTVQAAETGHLVLSTLHTNNAPSAITRLRDLGVGDVSLCGSLRLVISQRLIRRICDECKFEYRPEGVELAYLESAGMDGERVYYKGEGCDSCRGTGYRGLDIIYEILPLDEYDYEKIRGARTTAEIKEFAKRKGYTPMKSIALQKVAMGITTIKEVLRTCG